MLPSVLASQLQQGVEDFLQTTFPCTTPHFHNLLDRFFDQDGALFKGPYVSINRPFEHSSHGSDYFPEVPLGFTPFAHQARAFERLAEPDPQSTLVATGTGSGKTEAFLWPLLNYVRQHQGQQGERGIKAIIIYPMNALATDQATRIAEAVHEIDALDGTRVGLYIGDRPEEPSRTMGADHVITSRNALQQAPPDILLTNYKMLDYLLVRPGDARIWQHNDPDTLKYLVVDELHTFDGAQGTDLACLIRRLKDRLGVSEGGLCCVGTSATLGGSEDSTRLRQYAEDVFDTPFEGGAVIGETRQTAEAFLQPVRYTIFPDLEQHDGLQPEAQAHPADYVAAQIPHWFPEGTGSDWDLTTDAGRIALGEALRRHLMTHSVVDLLDDRPAEISDLAARLEARLPQLKGIARRQQTAMLRSFLSVLSWARTVSNSGGEARPFVQLRTQLWLREMRRMVASVDDPPVLAFHDDLPESEHDGHLPVAHCLECGAMGWVGIQRPNETTIRTGLKNIYQKFFASDPSCVFAFPVGADERVDAEGRYHQLCTHDLHLNDADADACTACDQEDGLLRVFMPHVQRTTQDDTQVSVRDCPHCGASSTLTIMGSRAASLSSVMISQLFASEYNTDKKLLTFSDSVQDAAHRAGFFESRTYRFNIRSAIQQYVDQAPEPVTLDEAMRQITDHYTQTYSDEAFVSNFIAPDMRWLRDYDQMLEQGMLPDESDIVTRVRKRLSWETWSEYGFRARIGRTLEKTGASTLQVDTGRLQSAVDALVPELQNNVGDLREVAPTDVARFVRGLIAHMKNQGAIYHPELDRYIEQGGNSYMLNRQYHLPNYGYRSRLPAFVASRSTQRFDPVLTPASNADSWLQAWATKCFGAHDPMLSSVMDQLYDRVLRILVTNNLLERRETSKGVRIWGVRPDALRVTTAVRQLRCDTCDHNASVAHDVVDDWQGTRCLRYQCTGRYASEAHAPNYYRQLYTQSARRRIIAREHTGLLEREERETLEKAFDHNEHPWDPNLISCTPTLEMGVDIGKLSTVMLCSVPPSPSNFVQRIGRGGRRTGNALDVTVANGQPHDLYFFEDPTEMIAGTIEPPGIYLNATYVLFRQFVAFCFDRWIASGEVGPQAVPGTLGRALPTLKVEGAFPDTWLSFVEMNEDELFADFIALFSDTLDEDDISELRSVIAKEGGFRYQVMGRFESVVKRRKAIKRDVQRIRSRIRKHEDGPASNQAEEEIKKLRQEKTALQRIDAQIRSMSTYNFLTESGLLPNYAFPEEGVTLRSVLLRGEEIWAKEYRRPASQALKELAPGATFYAGGRSVQVDQIDLSGEDTLQEWRLCDQCGHLEQVVEEGGKAVACPHCGSPQWADSGQRHTLVPHQEVSATTLDRKSRITDDTEGRSPSFYDTRLHVGIRKQDVDIAYEIKDGEMPFGFEFAHDAELHEINFGEPGPNDRLEYAGEPVYGKGFDTCPQCGRVHIDDDGINHTQSCTTQTQHADADEVARVALFRQMRSEAVRILLPETSIANTERRVHSLKAALLLGLTAQFKGNVSHLKVAIQEHQTGPEAVGRKRFLVLYDSVPGGTGYLPRLLKDKEAIIDVFEQAYEIMATCSCRHDEDKDGCYQCVYAYRNAYEMEYTSRQAAMDVIEAIMKGRDALVPVDSVEDISVASVVDSELEERFIHALDEDLPANPSRLEKHVVNGGRGWRLYLGAGEEQQRYDIEPQVPVGPDEGVAVPCTVDFVIHPLDADMRPIALFMDGWAYHRRRIGTDMLQRRALRASGRYYTWTLTWNDISDGDAEFANYRFPEPKVRQLLSAMDCHVQGDYKNQNSFEWLCDLLQSPNPEHWKQFALAHGMAAAVGFPETTDNPQQDWRKSLRTHAPDSLCRRLEEEADHQTAVMGYANPFTQGAGASTSNAPALLWAVTNTDAVEAITSDVDQSAAGLSVALYIDDKADLERSAWNGYLRLYNMLQFIPGVYPITASLPKRDRSTPYDSLWETQPPPHTAGDDRSSEGNTPSEDSQPDPTPWTKAIEYALPETEDLIRQLGDAGAPVPQMPYQHQENGPIVAEAEMGWPQASVAVVLPEQASSKAHLEEAGWEVFTLQEAKANPDELLDHLNGE